MEKPFPAAEATFDNVNLGRKRHSTGFSRTCTGMPTSSPCTGTGWCKSFLVLEKLRSTLCGISGILLNCFFFSSREVTFKKLRSVQDPLCGIFSRKELLNGTLVRDTKIGGKGSGSKGRRKRGGKEEEVGQSVCILTVVIVVVE